MEAAQQEIPPPALGDSAALTARDVVKRWSGRAVVDGAGISLARGTVTWLGGRNGSGKTTFLRLLAGLIDPDAGEIRLDGLHPMADRREYQRRLGFLPAGNGALYARLSVADNLEFWAGLAMLPRRVRRTRIESVLARFELAPLAHSRVDRLSMGQRQRIRIAMTFLHEPEVVLLDEPHTSLDEDGIRLLDSALAELTGRSGCALWCSPGREGIPIPADLSFVLRDGRPVDA